METVLTERNVALLQQVFSTKKAYENHLQTLVALRAMVYKNIENCPEGENAHPQYPIFRLLNDLIGALLIDGYNTSAGRLELHGQPIEM